MDASSIAHCSFLSSHTTSFHPLYYYKQRDDLSTVFLRSQNRSRDFFENIRRHDSNRNRPTTCSACTHVGLDSTSKSWFNILGCKDTSIDPHPSPTTVVAGSTRSASKIQTILPSYSVNQYCRRTPIQSHSFLVGGYRALFHMKRIPKDSLLIDFNSSYDPNNILRIDRSLYPLPSRGAAVSTQLKLGTTNRQHGTKKKHTHAQ